MKKIYLSALFALAAAAAVNAAPAPSQAATVTFGRPNAYAPAGAQTPPTPTVRQCQQLNTPVGAMRSSSSVLSSLAQQIGRDVSSNLLPQALSDSRNYLQMADFFAIQASAFDGMLVGVGATPTGTTTFAGNVLPALQQGQDVVPQLLGYTPVVGLLQNNAMYQLASTATSTSQTFAHEFSIRYGEYTRLCSSTPALRRRPIPPG